MKKVLRKCAVVGLVVLMFAIGALAALSLMARQYVSRDALVRMAEGEINSRVQIGSAKLSLFRLPARITLKDVALAPRDAELAKPPGERAALTDAPVRVKEVRLAVSLGALLQRRVEIKEFVFEEPRLEITVYEKGGTSLDDLLKSPEERKTVDGATGRGDDLTRGKDGEELLNTRSLNIYAHGFLARLRNVRFEVASLDLVIEKTGMVMKVRDLDAHLDEIDLDPSAIEKTNTARVRLEGRVEIEAVKDGLRYAELPLMGQAAARLFDPASGDLDLDLLGDFELGADAYVNAQIPVIQKAWGLLQKLDAIGIEIDDLPERATFGRSRSLAVHYKAQRFTLRKPVSVWFKDWEVAALEGTWIQTETDTHQGAAEIIAEKQLSEKLRKQIGRGVDYLPSELRPALVAEVEKTWFREGRLLAEIKTKGEFASPSVSIRNKFPDIGEILKKAGRDFLKNKAGGLLKDLLGGP